MNIFFHPFLLLVLLASSGGTLSVLAADDGASPLPYQADLHSIQERLNAKFRANHRSAAELAPEMDEVVSLLAKYHGQPEAQAAIAVFRASLTLNILQDETAAKALYEGVRKDFPGTKGAATAAKLLAALTPEAKAASAAKIAEFKAKKDALIGSVAPEIDFRWSTRPGLRSLADLHGQVVVLDFWATWCGPCIKSFPKLREEVTHFQGLPVVFIGVTSLQGKVHGLEAKPIEVKDKPEQEYALTGEFMKKYEMTWPVAFSAQNVFNPDYLVMGIPNIVIIAPDGTVRHLGLNPYMPGLDIEGKVKAILKEFGLPIPR